MMRTFFFILLAAALPLAGCGDTTDATAPPGPHALSLSLRPVFDAEAPAPAAAAAPSRGAASAAAYDGVRVRLLDPSGGAPLHVHEQGASPEDDVLELVMVVPDPVVRAGPVDVTVELLPGEEDTEEALWSGRIEAVDLEALARDRSAPVRDVLLYRGPVDNLFVTGLSIVGAPALLAQGGTARLTADVRTDGGRGFRVYWRSLAPGVLAVDDAGHLVPGRAGTAPIVARAGPAVDRVEIVVGQTVGTLLLEPGELRVERLGTEVTFDLTALDLADDPMPDALVEWSVDDPRVAASLGRGRLRAEAPGVTRVRARAVDRPGIAAEARLRVEPPEDDGPGGGDAPSDPPPSDPPPSDPPPDHDDGEEDDEGGQEDDEGGEDDDGGDEGEEPGDPPPADDGVDEGRPPPGLGGPPEDRPPANRGRGRGPEDEPGLRGRNGEREGRGSARP